MYRFNSFTQKANEVLNLAIKAAENYGHNYVGSEHILVGLLKEGTGLGATTLNENGITLDDVAYQRRNRSRKPDKAFTRRLYAEVKKNHRAFVPNCKRYDALVRGNGAFVNIAC